MLPLCNAANNNAAFGVLTYFNIIYFAKSNIFITFANNMDKYVIIKHFKGKNMGIVGDVIYYSKEKADKICDALQTAINKLTPHVKYKVEKYG